MPRSVRRKVEGWVIMCAQIPGFRESMKELAKQTADFRRICNTVSNLTSRRGNQQQLLRMEAVVGCRGMVHD